MSSSVSMVGIAVLENPRQVSAQVIVFDMVVFVGGDLQQLIGSVRYFNAPPADGEEPTQHPDIGLYNVTTTVSQMESEYQVYDSDPSKYAFVGDIKKLYLIEALAPSENNGPREWTINPAQLITVHVCCVVTSDDQLNATFTGEPEQWTMAFADVKKKAEAASKPVPSPAPFPFFAVIPNSQRFTKGGKKPTPFANKYSGFMGFLIGMESKLEGEKLVDRFKIEVETVAFMGNYYKPAKGASASSEPFTPSPAPRASSSKSWGYGSSLKKRKHDDFSSSQ